MGVSILRDIAKLAIFAVLIFVLFQVVLPRHLVQGTSMEPTLDSGDRVIRVPSFFEQVQFYDNDGLYERGDIVIFEAPPAYYTVPNPAEDEDFIKRVVGIPGDVVDIREGNVYVNGELHEAPMLQYTPLPSLETPTIVYPYRVPADAYFVLGDNRAASSDSRYWGVVLEETIAGRVLARYWPLAMFDFF